MDTTKTDGPISAFITNLGKYNEGELVGKWHSFPTTPEEIQQTLKEIGIGEQYEEFFITDYDTDIKGVYDLLGEYTNLDELNYLAAKIEEMSDWEAEQFEAAIELGDHSSDIAGLINLTENLDNFDYLQGVNDDSDLGYYWIEDSGVYDTKAMGNLSNYIDYERFGRDIRLDESGVFAGNGYVANREGLDETYSGIEDIPDEYRVFPEPDEPEAEQDGKNMTVLLVEPENMPREIEIDGSLESMQGLVGGTIQAVYPYDDPVALVCNDEGKMEGLPLNRALYDEGGKMYDIVAGNFFVCGLSDDDFASLPPDMLEKFSEQFKQPEQFVKLAGQIVAVKMPVEKPKDGPEKTADKPKTNEPEL